MEGDRLLWRKDADPYQMKLVKAKIRSRQRQRCLLLDESIG